MSEAGTLNQQFVIEGELGRGGMGVVFRARERHTGRPVALKIVLAQSSNAAQRERFRREGELTARLQHPGIVRVHASGESEGRPWLAYELVDGGGTLESAIRVSPIEEQARMVRDAARALGAAHALGIVHRDVKPSNLLVDREGRVRVADFGLATAQDLDRMTQTGALLGTPSYMAPEMLASKGQVGPPVDVWALGVVLYQGLTGRLPFDGATLLELAAEIERGQALPPRQINPEIPRPLETICSCALDPDPEARYPVGDALADDLERFLEGRPILAQPRGGRRPWAVLGVVGALAAALLGAAVWAGRPAPSEEDPRVLAAEDSATDSAPGVVLLAKAEAGDPEAMVTLGHQRQRAGDTTAAERWFRAAANKRSHVGMLRLARLLDDLGQTSKALRWWRKAAAKGAPPGVQVPALLRLAEEDRAKVLPMAALEKLRVVCGLGWDAEIQAKPHIDTLVRDAGAHEVRRWGQEIKRPSQQDPALGRMSLRVALACGNGNWDATPEWYAARRSWLSFGFRVGDPTCALHLIEAAAARGRPFPEEVGTLIVDQAKAGRPDGLLALAVLRQRGLGRPRDDAAALRLLRRVEEYPPGVHHLGIAYRDGRGVPESGKEALRRFRSARAAGVWGAHVALIRLLAAGRAEPESPTELRTLLEAAAKAQVPWAQALLAPGPKPSSPSKEMAHLVRAAEGGDTLSVLAVASLKIEGRAAQKDVLGGLRLLVQEANKGKREAMARVADVLAMHFESPHDYYYWSKRAADLGLAKAQVRIGGGLCGGGFPAVGVERDPAKGKGYLLAARKQGDRQAALILGDLCREGRPGIPKDLEQAERYYREASQAGSRDAGLGLARLFLFESEDPQAWARGVKALRRAIALGSSEASVILAGLQRVGRGVRKSPQRARRALERLVRDPNLPSAKWVLGRWLYQEAKTPRQRGKAIAYIRRAARRNHVDAQAFLRHWQERLPE